MQSYTKFSLCGLNIIFNHANYYTINGKTVIMQPETLDEIKKLHEENFVFIDFEEFALYLKTKQIFRPI